MSTWITIDQAAPLVGVGPEALRARCRRAARKRDGQIIAQLGLGIVAKKFGRSWRLHVPPPEPASGVGRV
jgi:hypothetical protein